MEKSGQAYQGIGCQARFKAGVRGHGHALEVAERAKTGINATLTKACCASKRLRFALIALPAYTTHRAIEENPDRMHLDP